MASHVGVVVPGRDDLAEYASDELDDDAACHDDLDRLAASDDDVRLADHADEHHLAAARLHHAGAHGNDLADDPDGHRVAADDHDPDGHVRLAEADDHDANGHDVDLAEADDHDHDANGHDVDLAEADDHDANEHDVDLAEAGELAEADLPVGLPLERDDTGADDHDHEDDVVVAPPLKGL